MLKYQRAKFIMDYLESAYPKMHVPLKNNNNFELLVAVLLSAQCTDERVNKVTPFLFAKANNPFEMQKIDVGVIYNIIRPCGLAPKKSKAIHDLSKILVDKFNGIVPKDIEELEKLPGVGHKTASVVISQGFGLPAFPVDTHIHRLAQRWGLTSGKNVKETEKDLKKLFPSEQWNKLHLQIIFYGREFCSAWSCDGTICKICTTCYPKRKKPFKNKKT
ncbi:endonuclease III [Alphaproteobacteria bacterium]|nr:endonuclease III [Alphaproteobacteria bacterium]